MTDDMTPEERNKRDMQTINDILDRLGREKARLREGRTLSLFSSDLEHQLYRTLDSEIQDTGQAARDAIRRIADSFDRAMTAVVNAAHGWEDKANL